jgi:hypothetical protein
MTSSALAIIAFRVGAQAFAGDLRYLLANARASWLTAS